MDAIEPILPNPSILPEVRAAQRTAPAHRDGHQGGGAYRQHPGRRDEEDAVEVDVDGIEVSDDADADGSATLLELPAPRLIDVTADVEVEPPARRIDVTDDDDGEAPARHIDLSA